MFEGAQADGGQLERRGQSCPDGDSSCRTASAFWSSTAKSGTTAAARSLSNRTASELASVSADGSTPSPGTDMGGTDILTSPFTPSACRLVVRRWRSGQPFRSVLAKTAHASSKCSQLSSTQQQAFAGEEVRERDQRPVR